MFTTTRNITLIVEGNGMEGRERVEEREMMGGGGGGGGGRVK